LCHAILHPPPCLRRRRSRASTVPSQIIAHSTAPYHQAAYIIVAFSRFFRWDISRVSVLKRGSIPISCTMTARRKLVNLTHLKLVSATHTAGPPTPTLLTYLIIYRNRSPSQSPIPKKTSSTCIQKKDKLLCLFLRHPISVMRWPNLIFPQKSPGKKDKVPSFVSQDGAAYLTHDRTVGIIEPPP